MKTKTPRDSGGSSKSCLTALGSFAGLALIAIFLPVVVELLLWGMAGFLIVADPIGDVDAVVVLSGGGDDSRLEEAARLFADGHAQWVILTETGETLPDSIVSYSAQKRKELIDLGIAEEAIIITEKHVSSTWSEARVVMKLMLRQGLKSCMVVTDPFHARRTRMVFRDEFVPRGLSVSVQPVRGHWYRSPTWWSSAEGRQVTFTEYSKLFGYVFLGMKQD